MDEKNLLLFFVFFFHGSSNRIFGVNTCFLNKPESQFSLGPVGNQGIAFKIHCSAEACIVVCILMRIGFSIISLIRKFFS